MENREGYSQVYEAHDRSSNRNVALKLIGAPDSEDQDKILQCMATARDLARTILKKGERVKGLPLVYDVLDPDPPGCPAACIIQEWVAGDSLAALLKKQFSSDLRDLIRMTLSLGQTLTWLHSQKLVHCDVRPTEIMVRFVSGDPVGVRLG